MNLSCGGGGSLVIFSGTALLMENADKRLPELHTTLYAAMTQTKLSRQDVSAALGARQKKIMHKFVAISKWALFRCAKRQQRGARIDAAGRVRQAEGRSPMGKQALAVIERQRKHRAHKALMGRSARVTEAQVARELRITL